MNALRLAAISVALTALLVMVALGCGNDVLQFTDCGTLPWDEKAADGGSDPCHCDPPPSLGIMGCACLSDPENQQAIDDYGSCEVLYRAQVDASDGGP